MWHDWDVDSWKDSFGWVSEDKPYGNILISTLYFPDAFPELYWWPEGPFQVHPRYRGGRSNKIQWIWWEDVPEAGRQVCMEQGWPEAGLVNPRQEGYSDQLRGSPREAVHHARFLLSIQRWKHDSRLYILWLSVDYRYWECGLYVCFSLTELRRKG